MRRFPSHKGSWSRPLADLVGAAINPVLARQGFGQSDLILFWDDIVGQKLAAMSRPIKLQWPVRERALAAEERRASTQAPAAATLVVRVETGFALEMQHLSGVIIERVNAHLGWRCVARLTLKQGPVDARAIAKPAHVPLEPAAIEAAATLVGGISDDSLRLALTRLGARVVSCRQNGAQGGKDRDNP
ncbi:DUF721 domain-containing protein [Methylocapsa aurea]|uniref:DUF721 domain-containing protein n=1 Tax=Methylocapsa aurea TaxID=663610 RepID=UPI000561D931|nr:DciA family protein [Methylocapsa aurea]